MPCFSPPNKKCVTMEDLVGKEFESLNYGSYKVVQDAGKGKFLVQFTDTGTEKIVARSEVKNGSIRDSFRRNYHGVGYIGEGSPSTNKRCFDIWSAMLSRCYNKNTRSFANYGARGVQVCDEWCNYHTFQKWYENNYREGMVLDKDIMAPDFISKVYSPEFCRIIPHQINGLFTLRSYHQGSLPLGVTIQKNNGMKKYLAQINRRGERFKLGCHYTPDEAFLAYKTAKEEYVKELADEYYSKGMIEEEIRSKLYQWEAVPYPLKDTRD